MAGEARDVWRDTERRPLYRSNLLKRAEFGQMCIWENEKEIVLVYFYFYNKIPEVDFFWLTVMEVQDWQATSGDDLLGRVLGRCKSTHSKRQGHTYVCVSV
jgi:hypothetical protein